MSTQDVGGRVRDMARAARAVAVSAAENALETVVAELMKVVDDDDDRLPVVLSQDPKHPGAPARPIDAMAQTAVRRGAESAIEERDAVFSGRVSQICYVGEESGSQTQLIRPGTLVVRSDPLDGTSNAVNLLQGYCSVVTVDYIDIPGKRGRHLGGAILGGDIDISWEQWSRRSQTGDGYHNALGRVYVRSVRLRTEWRAAEVSQEYRVMANMASVAASESRFRELEAYREAAFAAGGIVYHLAGNPFCAALLFGEVGSFVEIKDVTLHDSAYLIPHWLLGGATEGLDGSPLNYIDLYEENIANFDVSAKPVPPFVAFYGRQNPFSVVGEGREARRIASAKDRIFER